MSALLEAPPANTPEWVLWRRQGLGASDLAAVLGLDPYRTEHELWEVKTGRVPAFDGNAKTRWGHRLERVGLEVWEEAHPGGWPVANDRPYTRAEFPHLWATPDALGDSSMGKGEVGIEVKVTEAWQTPPERVRIQCLVQIGLADLERVDVVRLSFSDDPAIFPIERDDAAIADILSAGEAWYVRHVVEGMEPPLREDERPADERQAKLADQLHAVRKAQAVLEQQERAIRDDLIASVAGQGLISGQGWRIDVTRARAATRTGWSEVASVYRKALGGFGWGETDMDAVESLYQTTGRPSTRLTARWDEE